MQLFIIFISVVFYTCVNNTEIKFYAPIDSRHKGKANYSTLQALSLLQWITMFVVINHNEILYSKQFIKLNGM
jgi:hypothetical protein